MPIVTYRSANLMYQYSDNLTEEREIVRDMAQEYKRDVPIEAHVCRVRVTTPTDAETAMSIILHGCPIAVEERVDNTPSCVIEIVKYVKPAKPKHPRFVERGDYTRPLTRR